MYIRERDERQPVRNIVECGKQTFADYEYAAATGDRRDAQQTQRHYEVQRYKRQEHDIHKCREYLHAAEIMYLDRQYTERYGNGRTNGTADFIIRFMCDEHATYAVREQRDAADRAETQ